MNIWSELDELIRKYNNYEITLKEYFDLKDKICNKYTEKIYNKVIRKEK